MSQLFALLYKNYKIMSKQRGSTLMLLVVPALCLAMSFTIQYLVKRIASDHKITPPFDLPFGAAFPINMPLDNPQARELGARTCLRMNKYGFTSAADPFTQHYVDHEGFNFQSTSGLRRSICNKGPDDGIVTPHFNKTGLQTPEQMSTDLLNQMEGLYESNLNDIQKLYVPTDGYYLFDSASAESVSGVLMSNNMINFLYHHRSLQTSALVADLPVA